jgi:hypothetical protein
VGNRELPEHGRLRRNVFCVNRDFLLLSDFSLPYRPNGLHRQGFSLELKPGLCYAPAHRRNRAASRDLTLSSVKGYESGVLKVKKEIPG